MYKLSYYVPVSYLESTKQALFDAGAGRVGNYDSCCWQTPGQGQFRPLAGSTPYRGVPGQLELVEEYKVEMICVQSSLENALGALRAAHPYEEPAIDVVRLESVP